MKTKSQDIRIFPIVCAVTTFILIIILMIASHFITRLTHPPSHPKNAKNPKNNAKIAKAETSPKTPSKVK